MIRKWFTVDIQQQQRVAWGLLFLVMLSYAVVMSHQSILRYETFKATAFDLGNMDQVLWNTLHGRWFQFTNQSADWYGPPTRLAIHFEPIILPLSLLYIFHADPRILLVFQTLVLTSGALPIFLLTRRSIPAWPLLAPFMATAYLLSPALLGLNIFDFHPVSLATPLLLYAILALNYRRYGWFLLGCILAASCKEDIPLTIALLGFILIWRYKLPRLGLVLVIGGFLWSLLAFTVIIPHFYPGAQHNNYWYRYEALGSSPSAAIVNLILHPWLLFTTFITLDRLYYLTSLFRSSGFLALLGLEWLIPALPSLAVNLLSVDPLLYSGIYHYNATVIPFMMLAAIQGAQRVRWLWQKWRGEETTPYHAWVTPNIPIDADFSSPLYGPHRLIRGIVGTILRQMSLLTVYVKSKVNTLQQYVRHSTQWRSFNERVVALAQCIPVPQLQFIICIWITAMLVLNFMIAIPGLFSFWPDHEPGSREQHIQQLLDMIPANSSVSASDNLNPHLSERQYLAVFPSYNNTVQYIVVDLNNILPESRIDTANALNQFVTSGQFRILARAEGVVILVRHSN